MPIVSKSTNKKDKKANFRECVSADTSDGTGQEFRDSNRPAENKIAYCRSTGLLTSVLIEIFRAKCCCI